MDTLLTVRQLQDLLQVDRITIYRMLGNGQLRGFKVGGQWRFSRQELESWLQDRQAGLETSEPLEMTTVGPGPAGVADTLPLPCIQAIQDIFAQALGIAVVTTAMDGTPITSVANGSDFCGLILGTDAGRQRCIASWRAAAAARRRESGWLEGKTPPLARCHAGLCYVSSRIEVEGQLAAAIHAGQFLDRPLDLLAQQARLAELAATTGVQVDRLRVALARSPLLDEAKQQQIPFLVQRVALAFAEIGAERRNLLGRLQRIAEMTRY